MKDGFHVDFDPGALPPEAVRELAHFVTYLVVDCGYRDVRLLDETRYAAIMPLLFTHAIITGRIGDRVGYNDRWCFHSAGAAAAAMTAWDGTGEPEGWHRHPGTGRRRRILEGGEIEEYVDP